MQTPHITDPDYKNFPYQPSSVEQVIGISEDTIFSFRSRFPGADPKTTLKKVYRFSL